MYERLIREIKKVFYKTLGKTHLSFAQFEAVVMDIERHLNNRPLTYVESDGGGEEVLTPNSIMWGQQSHILEDPEEEEELVLTFSKGSTACVDTITQGVYPRADGKSSD